MATKLPIQHWSHSSLMTFLRNPLAWYKRYVELVYDTPYTMSSVVGRAAHVALQNFYGGISKEGAVEMGLAFLRNVPDFEINFGKAASKRAKKKKRDAMEREYLRSVWFFLKRPPKYDVVGVEVKGVVKVKGLPLPLKAVSDLVVVSKFEKEALDVVDFKFVDSFSKYGKDKSLFVIQAIFNYYTVSQIYSRPVRRFIVHEVKKSRNADGRSQLRKYVINFAEFDEEFKLFHRLIKDATIEIARRRIYLPNPSDMLEGENSFDIYRLGLVEQKN
ncbi:MAG TPA: PD-(D/E)XK nuclease family protein [Candidatus Paceibacterota bacterium]|nr:PD-(D/E)XK nuclease family protein [Candidatus Paceibacterota bacterium]